MADVRVVKVIRGADFGVFVEDEHGGIGLMALHDMTQGERITHPLQRFPLGMCLSVVVVLHPPTPGRYQDLVYTYVASHAQWTRMVHGDLWRGGFLRAGMVVEATLRSDRFDYGCMADFDVGPFRVTQIVEAFDLEQAGLEPGDSCSLEIIEVDPERARVLLIPK